MSIQLLNRSENQLDIQPNGILDFSYLCDFFPERERVVVWFDWLGCFTQKFVLEVRWGGEEKVVIGVEVGRFIFWFLQDGQNLELKNSIIDTKSTLREKKLARKFARRVCFRDYQWAIEISK